jgi:3-phosphoshikimate 1-carboxyvinyltransferase
VAQRLGYHYLDSGALYRVTAYAALQAGLSLDTEHRNRHRRTGAPAACGALKVSTCFCLESDVAEAIRTEEAGMNASKVSALPAGASGFGGPAAQLSPACPACWPMGATWARSIFPDAPLKVFLTASAEKRAERRHKQLISKGFSDYNLRLFAQTWRRVTPATHSAASHLSSPHEDALQLDNSQLCHRGIGGRKC